MVSLENARIFTPQVWCAFAYTQAIQTAYTASHSLLFSGSLLARQIFAGASII